MHLKQIEKTFMVSSMTDATPKASGNRIAVGTDALRETVTGFLVDLTPESKELMRGLMEQDQATVVEMFRGKANRVLYNARQTKRVDIYLISGVRGL